MMEKEVTIAMVELMLVYLYHMEGKTGTAQKLDTVNGGYL